MTKLMQLLLALGVLTSLWVMIVTEKFTGPLSPEIRDITLMFPLYLLMMFACYSLAVLGYRVYTFNDCTEAAVELQKEIVQAREDLRKKGFKE